MKTTEQSQFWTRFWDMPVIGIARNLNAETLDSVIPIYIEAGFRNIEITMNSVGAEQLIKNIESQWGTKLNIGAGTVCNMFELDKALNAGASFIVTPIVNEELISTCRSSGIPIFPGAMTATEIYKAWEAGADLVKLFPFSSLHPGYLKEIAGPFPSIKLMPTGGVGIHNCREVLKAGAVAIGAGGQLFVAKMIAEKNWNGLSEHFTAFANAVSEAINNRK